MKKISLLLLALTSSVALVSAQNNKYLQMYPNTEGAKLVSKCYDAFNNHNGTVTVTVDNAYDYNDGSKFDLNMEMRDKNNQLVNNGKMNGYYVDGNLYVDSKILTVAPCLSKHINADTEIVADPVYYPNAYITDDMLMVNDNRMETGNIIIREKGSDNELARASIKNRRYDKKEKITTPAGTFMAGKLTYDVEVNDGNMTHTYHVKEWHAPGAGIVRTEVYNDNGLLEDYTVLTSLTKR